MIVSVEFRTMDTETIAKMNHRQSAIGNRQSLATHKPIPDSRFPIRAKGRP